MMPDWEVIRRLLRIGIPGGADMLAVIGCQLWFLSVINQLGDLPVAAHGVAICAESLAFLPGVAFQAAAATLVGQFLGARDHRRASRSVLMACLVGGGLMVTAGIVFATLAPWLAGLLVGENQLEVAVLATPLVRIVSAGIPALALMMILSGALRGAGDTRWPLLFSLIGLLGVRIPLAYLLAFESISLPILDVTVDGFNLGVIGAWYAMVADLWVRAILVTYRFWHGGWKRIVI
jgi:Na+-driven multidrug efflux pump